jgi:hypothetical protein
VCPISKFLADEHGTELDISHRGIGARGAIALSACLPIHSRLKALRLEGNCLKREGCEALMTALVKGCACADSDGLLPTPMPGMRAPFCRACRSTVSYIDLRNNLLESDAAELISQMLQSSHVSLSPF